jgi:3-methyladenine DNA glycosylase Tag
MSGTFIRTCHNENKKVLALEGNKEIFDNFIMSLTNEHPNEAPNEQLDDQNHMLVDDDDIGLIIE